MWSSISGPKLLNFAVLKWCFHKLRVKPTFMLVYISFNRIVKMIVLQYLSYIVHFFAALLCLICFYIFVFILEVIRGHWLASDGTTAGKWVRRNQSLTAYLKGISLLHLEDISIQCPIYHVYARRDCSAVFDGDPYVLTSPSAYSTFILSLS